MNFQKEAPGILSAFPGGCEARAKSLKKQHQGNPCPSCYSSWLTVSSQGKGGQIYCVSHWVDVKFLKNAPDSWEKRRHPGIWDLHRQECGVCVCVFTFLRPELEAGSSSALVSPECSRKPAAEPSLLPPRVGIRGSWSQVSNHGL